MHLHSVCCPSAELSDPEKKPRSNAIKHSVLLIEGVS